MLLGEQHAFLPFDPVSMIIFFFHSLSSSILFLSSQQIRFCITLNNEFFLLLSSIQQSVCLSFRVSANVSVCLLVVLSVCVLLHLSLSVCEDEVLMRKILHLMLFIQSNDFYFLSLTFSLSLLLSLFLFLFFSYSLSLSLSFPLFSPSLNFLSFFFIRI